MSKVVKKDPDSLKLEGGFIGDNVRDACLEEKLSPFLKERVIGRTNIGKGRKKNQDAASAYSYPDSKNNSHLVLTVADGLGAYRCAEKASTYVVQEIPRLISETGDSSSAFETVHQSLVRKMDEDTGSTTVVLAEISNDHLRISNVGDSRAYVIRGPEIVFQTRDQSMVELMLKEGRIAPEMARRHPLRNVILNSVGSPEATYQFIEEGKRVVKLSGLPTTSEFTLKKGDAVLLASDGFFTNFLENEIIQMITKTPWKELNQKMTDAIQQILKVGLTTIGELANPDNYTYLVYRHLSDLKL